MSKLHFNITYSTQWGEHLCVNLSSPTAIRSALPLTTTDGSHWEGTVEVPALSLVRYSYAVQDDAGRTLRTMRPDVLGVRTRAYDHTTVCDAWADDDVPRVFLHSAFTQCVFRFVPDVHAATEESPLRLVLHALPPSGGDRWGIVGSTPRLGEWDITKALPLERTDVYEWTLPLTPDDFLARARYKYVLLPSDGAKATWEDGDDRQIPARAADAEGQCVVNDFNPRLQIPVWRGAGVVLPVFSLRSKGSQGIGDFGDLRTFVVWAAQTGMQAVQILPINDTTSSATFRDSYPYNSISVFALHPIYLDLRPWSKSALFADYAERFARLNDLAQVDYEAVFSLKMNFLHRLFLAEGQNVMETTDYGQFYAANKKWLRPYAEYSLRKTNALRYAPIVSEQFFCYVQYLLHRQLLTVRDAARQARLILKGDIPIGVCPDSVPTLVDRPLFHFDGTAGAPPDAFARDGQNWGFPTYAWEAMARDGYAWWKHRLAHLAHYFDAYRIDHVLGFFRIWEIPSDQVSGLLGRFRPALPFSTEELRSRGFSSSPDLFSEPFVTAQQVEEAKKQTGCSDIEQYLTPVADGAFTLQPQWRSQRTLLAKLPDGPLRTTLMAWTCERLFVKDPNADAYHPRIGGYETAAFRTLSPEEQQAYSALHNHFFYERHNAFWAASALEKLSVITQPEGAPAGSTMLPCAEDLGMIPASAKEVLNALQILSLEIQRMPKTYGVEFDDLQQNPYLSVSTIATHDMPPFRLWWSQDPARAQRFWRDVLHREGTVPAEATPEVCEQVLTLHLGAPSILSLHALQDYLSIDPNLRRPDYEAEQINDPANPNQYWNYRMHLTLEQLATATAFNEHLRALIALSGRRN